MRDTEGAERKAESRRPPRDHVVADFFARWWPAIVALSVVFAAYYETRQELLVVRSQVRDVQEQITRLRYWLENPDKFPGRNADGEPLPKSAIERLSGDVSAVDLHNTPPALSAASPPSTGGGLKVNDERKQPVPPLSE